MHSAVNSLGTSGSATAATAANTAATAVIIPTATRRIIALSVTKPMKMIPATTAICVPIAQTYAPAAEMPAVTVLMYVRTAAIVMDV